MLQTTVRVFGEGGAGLLSQLLLERGVGQGVLVPELGYGASYGRSGVTVPRQGHVALQESQVFEVDDLYF